MNIIKIIREELESNDMDWIRDAAEDPRYSNYYIIDNRSISENKLFDHDDEWVLLKVINRQPNGDITYRHIEHNISSDDGWDNQCGEADVDGYWVDYLLGLGSSHPNTTEGKWTQGFWIAHDGDTSDLPKNRMYLDCNKLNESDDLKWIQDIKPSLSDIFNNGLINVGDIITLSGKLFDDDGRRPIEVQDFKIKIDTVGESLNSSYFTPLQEKYREFLGDDGDYVRFWKTDAEMKVVAHIKKGGIKESEDFEWAKDSENPIEYLNKHYDKCIPDGYGIIKPQDELLNVLKQDYRALFGVIRQPNKIYWEITDVHHPIKKLLSYEDFKDPEIRKLIKNYYKDKINSLNKKIKSHFPDDRQ